ncbi:MAG: hypothetical protein IPP19_05855 [Verrucomicrobia bacterium]|nr:hypothetical protein [Verrucomicrobiota bacterium]
MAKRAQDQSAFVQHVRFVGRAGGLVKTLGGFKKSHHTVPDAVNAATSAFLAKLCADELAADAEKFFQLARSTFGYKRKDVSLEVASPNAVLSAKDFTFELTYALDESDPASYTVVRSLYGLRSTDFAATDECDTVFAQQFSELVFVLTKGAPVEAVIDAVEGLDGDDALKVEYPSDCHDCTLAVADVSATVRFDGSELAMVFPCSGSPRELLEAFVAVRDAFALSKKPVLAALLK